MIPNTDEQLDQLCSHFNGGISVNWKPKHRFLNDINIIINEIITYENFDTLDIYELCISCGHDLTWNQNYVVSYEDHNWFKVDGKKYFIEGINTYRKIKTINDYKILLDIHIKLCELFELQLE